jgi:23S rRNA (cytosine1962-C5)-methyltransferase
VTDLAAIAESAARSEPVLRLKRGEERRVDAGHPWVFSNEVADATPLRAFSAGELARVESYRRQFLGHAYVNPHALICARIVSRTAAQPVDQALIERRLRHALALRERLHGAPYYRLVFGESDGLPGLVLDRYGEILVGQIATAGMEALRPTVEAAVRRSLAPSALFWKNDSGARTLEGLPQEAHTAFGEMPAELAVREGNLQFLAPLEAGQKTGWFYDQRANRTRLTRFLPRGARVLDVCSYVGAWGLTALAAGAASACCVDASETALAYAVRNAARNGLQLQTVRADAFEALTALRERGERFDAVVLDPPAFIKRKKDIPRGQAAYRKLNQLAMSVLAEDGLLVSCSCSYHLSGEALIGILQAAARPAGREVRILEAGGQSPDHPIHPAIPETRYLKAFFCRIGGEVGYTSPL